MKSLLTILIVTTGLAFTAEQVSAETAPDFTLSESPGEQQLSDLKGQVIYLDFWASWCVPCRKSFPWMNSIQEKYADRGFKVITVNLDKEPKLIAAFLKKYPAKFTIVRDAKGVIADQYQLQSMPSSYIIDASGEIIFSHTGFFEKKKVQYQQEIESLL